MDNARDTDISEHSIFPLYVTTDTDCMFFAFGATGFVPCSQCGGADWFGSNCCVEGFECVVMAECYSQVKICNMV